MKASTIAAIATPAGYGGVGIIKISGPESIRIARSVFRPIKSSGVSRSTSFEPLSDSFSPCSRYLYYGHVFDDETKRVLDEVLFVVMRAPHSYTAEDVVEIQSHSGPVVLKAILKLLIQKGVHLAEPGEFTRRAFLNGRIDLTQAEAVIDIINARSEKAIDMAISQISGHLNQLILTLRNDLVDILTHVEAAIDFPDDVGEDIDIVFLNYRIHELIDKICALISRSDEQNFLRTGLKIVIIGAPNVGKSSLMNRLLENERSIVTDIPGTTRDFIEDSFMVDGIPIVLTDTAGIHDNPDPVEEIGIGKAWEHIKGADIILFVVDSGFPASHDNCMLFEKLHSNKTIIVINKIDLPSEQIHFEVPDQWMQGGKNTVVRISALYNQGIDELKSVITSTVLASDVIVEDHVVPNLRQRNSLETIRTALEAASQGLSQSLPFELVSIDLKIALDVLSEITGEKVKSDILDSIFSRFCIGK